jgi:hypothetical protein
MTMPIEGARLSKIMGMIFHMPMINSKTDTPEAVNVFCKAVF